jgi:hypothetical protein
MSKKIALCISGELRDFNNPLITQGYDKFLNVHNPDVFISTWNHIGKSMNHGYIDPHENKIVYFSLEEFVEKTYSNIKYLNIETYNDWINSLDVDLKNEVFNNSYNYQTVNSFAQIYKISDSINLKTKYENEHNFKYDIVVRIRPDSLFVDHFNFDINLDTIYNINFGSAYYPNRIYDIFFYGASVAMDKIGNCFINFVSLLQNNFYNGLCRRDACRLLYLQAKNSGLNVETIHTRVCDTYRGQSLEEFCKLIESWNK